MATIPGLCISSSQAARIVASQRDPAHSLVEHLTASAEAASGVASRIAWSSACVAAGSSRPIVHSGRILAAFSRLASYGPTGRGRLSPRRLSIRRPASGARARRAPSRSSARFASSGR